MKKTILEDITRLAGVKLDENYIYAAEEDEDTAPDQVDSGSEDGEYSDEAGMAKDQLTSIERAAEELDALLKSDEDLPEWIQAKITKAQDYLTTATEVMKSRHEQGDVKTMEAKEKNKKPDFLDVDKDGDKEESFKKAVDDKEKDKEVAEAIQRMKDIAGLK